MFFKKNLLKKKIDQFLLQFFYYKKIILKLFEVYPNFWILINTVNFSICLFDPPTAIHHYKKELRPLPFLVLVSLPFQSRERERDRERERERESEMEKAINRQRVLLEHLRPSSSSSFVYGTDSSSSAILVLLFFLSFRFGSIVISLNFSLILSNFSI